MTATRDDTGTNFFNAATQSARSAHRYNQTICTESVNVGRILKDKINKRFVSTKNSRSPS